MWLMALGGTVRRLVELKIASENGNRTANDSNQRKV